VKSSEFLRWLEKKGCAFKPGKGSHLKAYLNGKHSVVPVHKGRDIKEGTRRAILKQLGLKDD
jgi:mRNA interferase HicA